MVIRGVPVDVVIVDDPLADPAGVDFDRFTGQWLEAYDWYLLCGGTPEGWWELSFAGRAQWIYSVAELERKVCR